jgi:hypothetical protein
MLEKKRKNWEELHEQELKRTLGLARAHVINISGEKRQGKIIEINRKKWLAAAVLIGLLGSGGVQAARKRKNTSNNANIKWKFKWKF